MASGHVTASKGRTHGCTDPQRDVKIFLANSEPSTHGTLLPIWNVRATAQPSSGTAMRESRSPA